jgi:hypothetical protein
MRALAGQVHAEPVLLEGELDEADALAFLALALLGRLLTAGLGAVGAPNFAERLGRESWLHLFCGCPRTWHSSGHCFFY